MILWTGEWLRQKLIDAGASGVCISDLHSERKTHYNKLGLLPVSSTYHSFHQYFTWLLKLGFIERTDKTEPSKAKGGEYQLKKPRLFYRITSLGISAELSKWNNLRLSCYPRPEEYKRKNYHKPKGGKRGRPRIADKEHRGKRKTAFSETV